MPRRPLAVIAALGLTAILVPSSVAASTGESASNNLSAKQSAAPSTEGSFTLQGSEAASYTLPDDVAQVWSTTYPDGTTQTRYQQVVAGAEVLGGQVTVLEDASGQATAVIGAHFPALEPTNARRLSLADSLQVAQDIFGAAGERDSTLHIDPRDGRLYYEVETRRFAQRPTLWVDATTGEVRNRFNALTEEGEGIGIKGDTKTFDTSGPAGAYRMISSDGRQETYDAQNQTNHPGVLMTDPDDVWDFDQPQNVSPSQAAGVDAHYYAELVDDFYADAFGRNSIDDNGMTIISTVHYDVGYCNAFWNGEQMTYGDGDTPETCKPLSGGLDVIGHELTHGVTEFTSGLIYENESGALNEAFSDMMGNTTEFYAEQAGRDPAAEPDWLIGEDVIPAGVYGGSEAGFRDMGDPRADGDPDHYSERYTGTSDNGGVHTNSGIPNHAYYLAVNGGTNAGCDAVGSGGHVHAVDCDVRVPALGLDRSQEIFYRAFTSLTEYANMCDARSATLAVAGKSRKAIDSAWAAVGVHRGCEPAIPPPPPCVGDSTAQIPFESPHPYGNNGDCTWTYDNGSAGFAFHFSLLETEAGYDYVYVKDADGNVIATYDGTHPLPGGVTTPCIPTSVGSVQLVTDMSVTDQGFTVDAVEPC
jgi:bacillolysin